MKDGTRWNDEILTSREARELLKIGRTKLWELTVGEVIPAYRIGDGRTSALRYKKSDLLGWLERHPFAPNRSANKERRDKAR